MFLTTCIIIPARSYLVNAFFEFFQNYLYKFPAGSCIRILGRRAFFPAGLFGGSMLFSSTLVVRYKLQIKQKLQRHNNAGVLGGRGWITRAALLKTARRADFALSLATAPQLFSSTRCVRRKIVQNKKFNALSYVELFWWARVDSNKSLSRTPIPANSKNSAIKPLFGVFTH